MRKGFFTVATLAALFVLGAPCGVATASAVRPTGIGSTCTSFMGECQSPCTRLVSGWLYNNCYNAPGGCCYGKCGLYSCFYFSSNPCIRPSAPYFGAEGLASGVCSGDARVECIDDEGCSGSSMVGR